MTKTVILVLFTAAMSVLLVIAAHVEAGRKQVDTFHWVNGR